MPRRVAISCLAVVVLGTGGASVGAQNLVANGRFNSGVEGWTVYEDVTFEWDPSDCDGNPGSGSGRATNTFIGANSGAVQCVSSGIVVGQPYDLRVSIRVPSGQSNTGGAGVFVWWRDGANCTGTQTYGPDTGQVSSADSWLPLEVTDALPPAGTQSATVYLNVVNSSGPGNFVAYFDSVFLGRSGTLLEDHVVYVPAAANNPGANDTQWNTDLELNDRGPGQISYHVALLPSGQDNSNPEVAGPFTLDPGQGVRLVDAIEELFPGHAISAALRFDIVGDAETTSAVLLTSRTYNTASSGTYGQFIPSVAEADLVPADHPVRLIQLSENADFRTNLGFLNGTAVATTVHVVYRAVNGTPLGEESFDLLPYEHRQVNHAFARVTAAAVEDGFIDVSTETIGAGFFTYASVVDNLSGDPIFIPARSALEDDVVYIPAVANNPGAHDTQWNTDLELNNLGAAQLSYRVELLPSGQDNSNPDKAGPFTLDAGEGVRYLDVVEQLFPGHVTSGALRLTLGGATASMLTSRTYNAAATGTYGQFIPAVEEQGLIPAATTVRLIQLSENAAFRTNLGFLNGTAANLTVNVRYSRVDGTPLGEESFELLPYEHRQVNRALTRVTSGTVDDAYVDVWSDTVGGAFFCYASVVDNLSGDPIFIPASG